MSAFDNQDTFHISRHRWFRQSSMLTENTLSNHLPAALCVIVVRSLLVYHRRTGTNKTVCVGLPVNVLILRKLHNRWSLPASAEEYTRRGVLQSCLAVNNLYYWKFCRKLWPRLLSRIVLFVGESCLRRSLSGVVFCPIRFRLPRANKIRLIKNSIDVSSTQYTTQTRVLYLKCWMSSYLLLLFALVGKCEIIIGC